MNVLKPAIYAFAAIGFGYVAFLLFVSSDLVRSCQLQPIVKLASPNAQHEARLDIEQCNDKRAPMVTLSVSSKANPDQATSVELGVATSNDFTVTWLSDHALEVSYPNTFRLSQEPGSVDNIDLTLTPREIATDAFESDLAGAAHSESNR